MSTIDVLPMREVVRAAGRGLVEREVLIELLALAAIAGEHVLVVGPPGTAKSAAVRRVARALGGKYFEYLLGRFTEPSEIFGPIDLRKLREGVVHTETSGMLPEAELAFLDEVFRGSTAILNTLLGILNERVFRRGHTTLRVPLRLCVGATNELPDDPSLVAFADRFLVRCFVDPVGDPSLEQLLAEGWQLDDEIAPIADVGLVDRLGRACRAVEMGPVRLPLAAAVRRLRSHGISMSDRRLVQAQRLVAAAAVLAERTSATRADLWPIIYAIPTREEQNEAREQLRDELAESDNPSLAAASEDASLGPLARARRLTEAGRELIGSRPPPESDAAARREWRARAEGVAREIDAGFAPEASPEDLRAVRSQLVDAMQD
jgi:MoxR-like ATPase